MTGSVEAFSRSGDQLFRIEAFSRTDSSVVRFYHLQGALSAHDLYTLSRELLSDPVTDTIAIHTIAPDGHILHTHTPAALPEGEDRHTLDVAYLPGVTDATAESLIRAAAQIGIQLQGAATGQRYFFPPQLTPDEAARRAVDCYNPVIQRISLNAPIAPAFARAAGDRAVACIALRTADDAALRAISAERRLALDLDEMRAVQAYYRAEMRDPTDVEIEMIAQTWSEHCVHKTFRAHIT